MDQDATFAVDGFEIGHQGAELLRAEGRKIGILAVFRGNSAVFRLKVVLNVGIF